MQFLEQPTFIQRIHTNPFFKSDSQLDSTNALADNCFCEKIKKKHLLTKDTYKCEICSEKDFLKRNEESFCSSCESFEDPWKE